MYLNEHVLSGRVGGDATLRNAGNSKVLSFRFAHSSPFGDKRTTWYNVSVWGNEAERLSSKITKGLELVLAGSSDAREYEDKNGNPRVSQEFRANRVQFVRYPREDIVESEEDDEVVSSDLF